MPDLRKQTCDDQAGRGDAFFEKYGLLVLLFLIVCISLFVYREYLFFQRAFIFTRASSDTLAQSFPRLFFRSEKLFAGEWPFWSFQFELGTNIFRLMAKFNPFDLILILSGKENIPCLIIYTAVLKIVTAGLFFYAFLKKLNISGYTAVIGALMYSFSGYMVINGHWYHYQDYAVFAAIMLFLFERWFQEGRWVLLVLAIGFLFLKTVFHVYQFALFFFLYGLFRLIMISGFRFKTGGPFFIRFAFLYLLGVGLGAFYFIPDARYVSTSSRGGGALADFSVMGWVTKIFGISSTWAYAKTTTFSRFFSNDLLGSWERFRGHNYFEVPASYIGLIGLVVLPCLFIAAKNKAQKRAFFFVIGICILYFIFPIIRTIGNAFASPTYKHTIMYVSIFLIILSSFAIDSLFSGKFRLKSKMALGTAIVLMLILAAWRISFGLLEIHVIDDAVLIRVVIFLAVYGAFFYMLSRMGPGPVMKIVLLLIVVVELALFARITVSRNLRWSLDSDFIEKHEFYFNADRLNALKYIKSVDKGFYRIEGNKLSRNTAIVLGYYGARGYLGFVRPGIVEFNETMALSRRSPRLASYREGLDLRWQLHSLLSVKYFFTRDPKIVPSGFFPWKTFGGLYVYRNKNFLPLGFCYLNYMGRPTFNSLPLGMKDTVFLKAFVSEKDGPYPGLGKLDDPRVESSEPVALRKEMFSTYDLRIISGKLPGDIECITANNDPQFSIDLTGIPVADGVRIKFYLESRADNIGQVFWKGDAFTEKHAIGFRIRPGRREYVILVDRPEISTLRIDLGDKPGQKIKIDHLKLFNVRLARLKPGWDAISRDVERLRRNSLKITAFHEDHFSGRINMSTAGMLFLGIPYDSGWHARVNGKDAEIEKGNIGFMGIQLQKGDNRVKLKYTPPYLYAGISISLICLAICIFLYCKAPLIIAFRMKKD
ncbi:MAG: hypothetical protein DSY90_06615 [Deltaproteobacteria bacterium]|nr:MAG: hypothetical protein DSY90_06615 [Deltaproteobacteria bacterium]